MKKPKLSLNNFPRVTQLIRGRSVSTQSSRSSPLGLVFHCRQYPTDLLSPQLLASSCCLTGSPAVHLFHRFRDELPSRGGLLCTPYLSSHRLEVLKSPESCSMIQTNSQGSEQEVVPLPASSLPHPPFSRLGLCGLCRHKGWWEGDRRSIAHLSHWPTATCLTIVKESALSIQPILSCIIFNKCKCMINIFLHWFWFHSVSDYTDGNSWGD